MLYVIDGSGPSKEKEYDTEMAGSFCKKIASEHNKSNCLYYRGPETISDEINLDPTGEEIRSLLLQSIITPCAGSATDVKLSTPLRLATEASKVLVPLELRSLAYGLALAPFLRVKSQVDERAREIAPLLRALPPKERVFLAGYSRGGATAIRVAQLVPDRKIEAMYLFDAVDRDPLIDTSAIPTNVETVFHAIRDPNFANILLKKAIISYVVLCIDSHIKKGNILVDAATFLRELSAYDHARAYFGNTGTECASPGTHYISKTFPGTHGALGGVPWFNIQGDEEASKQVGEWMWSNFATSGLTTPDTPSNLTRPSTSTSPRTPHHRR